MFADADLDEASPAPCASAFANSGQVCLGTERVYVERPIFDEFVARLADAAAAMKIGDPLDPSTELGPLISQEHRDKVLCYYRTAREEGATVVTGGGVPEVSGEFANGRLGRADRVDRARRRRRGGHARRSSARAAMSRPFDTEDEVVRLANDTPYGLAATVWTSDLRRAHRVAGRLDVGLCWVNSWFLRDLRTSFGGKKAVGHRPRGRRAQPRVLHRVEQRLREAVRTR